MDQEFWRLSASDAGALYARRELSPVELLAALLDRIDAINPRLNAIVTPNPQAEAAARDSERRLTAGAARSPLEGVPVTVKDNLLVGGLPATWGSRLYAGYVPDADELPVARLRQAGAVILGKTNVPAFTLEGYTDNDLFGVTRNPWDLNLTPGGSSGGAVAGVAAGLTPLAIGTDGGGSIRRPAGHTGLVGFKPSIGCIPRNGGFPQILLDFEVVGPMARSVEDAALVVAALAGPDRRDQRSFGHRADLGTGLAPAPEGLRILFAPRFGAAPLDPAIADSVAGAAALLADLGHRVSEGTLPFGVDEVAALWPLVVQAGLAGVLAGRPGAKELVVPKYLEMAAEGATISADRLLAAIHGFEAFRARVAEAFQDWDVIMTPSAAAMPWPAREAYPPEIDGQPVGPRGHAVYTGWVNACGHPAIALPGRPAADGLPIGFQLVGDFGADQLLLRLARQYQSAFSWSDRWPDLNRQAEPGGS